MSDPKQDHVDTHHEGPIRTPKQLIVAVTAAFLVPIIGIFLLASYVSVETQPGAGSGTNADEALAKRLQPVGRVEVRDASSPAALKTGEQVYQAQCVACHGAGVAGAPKLGDKAAWEPRIGAGYEALLAAALKGKGAMPPQGGGEHSDVEIGRAVAFMANQGGAKFDEPKAAPAAAAAASQPQADDAAAKAAAAQAASAVAAATASVTAAGTGTGAAAAAPAAAPAQGAAGAVPPLYAQNCQACHGAGLAGAPKLGDKAAWEPRLAQGLDALVTNAIKGKGAMPPKGGSAASDAEVRAVVEYMVGAVK